MSLGLADKSLDVAASVVAKVGGSSSSGTPTRATAAEKKVVESKAKTMTIVDRIYQNLGYDVGIILNIVDRCIFCLRLYSSSWINNSWWIEKVLSQLSSFLRFGPIPSHSLLKSSSKLEEKYTVHFVHCNLGLKKIL